MHIISLDNGQPDRQGHEHSSMMTVKDGGYMADFAGCLLGPGMIMHVNENYIQGEAENLKKIYDHPSSPKTAAQHSRAQ